MGILLSVYGNKNISDGEFMGETERNDLDNAYFSGAFVCYELLRRQSASNLLERTLKGDTDFEERIASGKYTKDRLPLIKESNLKAFEGIALRNFELYTSEWFFRVKNENPQILKFIEEYYRNEYKTLREKRGYAAGIFMTYDAIRRQAAAYGLEEMF